MKTVGQSVTDASSQLNDQELGREFTRWSRAQLLSYLNGALAELLSYKPQAFAQEIELVLVPGRKQTLEAEFNGIISINSNADGSLVTESELELLQAFSPYTCCAGEVVFDKQGNPQYNARTFAVDAQEPSTYYVSPEVPVGLAPKVKATVIVPPPMYTLSDWDEELPVQRRYQENILDYMMGRAFDIDTESPQSRSNADKHLSRFYTAMGIKYRIEEAYRTGKWNTTGGAPR